PAVDEALRNALDQATGLQKAGIITTLGARRDAGAVDAVAAALSDSDAAIARAAAGALGRIGPPEAANALTTFYASAPEGLETAAAEGLLAAAKQLVADGKVKPGMQVYKSVLSEGHPEFVRTGAF